MKHPKRLAIFGLPGSGKTTFADRLGKKLQILVHHLDRHYFVAKWEERNREEFLSAQKAMVKEESWIIEGNSIASLEMRFARAEVVIYFRLPRYLCVWRIFSRPFHHDKSIQDTPEGCSKSMSWKLLVYLWTFDKEKKERIEELKNKYPHVQFYTFYNMYDMEKFLRNVKK